LLRTQEFKPGPAGEAAQKGKSESPPYNRRRNEGRGQTTTEGALFKGAEQK